MAADNTQLLIFTNRLAAMVKSQLPLLDVLKNLAAEIDSRRLKGIVKDVCEDVEHGVDFGEALGRHKTIFDEIYISIVSAGMMSGRLGEALQQLADYLGRVNDIRNKMRTAMTYPIILTASFLAAFNVNIFWVLPRFQTLFQNSRKKLPFSTQILLDIGFWWQHNWHIMVLTVIASAIVFFFFLKHPQGRYFFDKHKLSLPVFGRLLRLSSLARMLRTLAVQLENDVDILKSLAMAGAASGNSYLKETVLQIADDIHRGIALADSFRRHNVFTGLVLQMVASGEATGNLSTLLMLAANYYDDILGFSIERWISLINPLLTILIGIAIALMLVATFMPVFDVGNIVV